MNRKPFVSFSAPSYFPKRVVVSSCRAATLFSLPYRAESLAGRVEVLCDEPRADAIERLLPPALPDAKRR